MLTLPLKFSSTSPKLPVHEVYALDGKSYRFFVAWNDQASRYFFDLYDVASGEALLLSQPIHTGISLIQTHQDQRFPPGDLIVIALDENVDDPKAGELGEGQNYQLIYITSEERENGLL